ncbi:bile acid:sodium symporter family protein [Sanyastnella coralliicola]|uniref:bile acid:sodium symporter family protein n=1 Tax=Sanyastnella coralliicola TaxID=3069118 RepID=UPI0027B9D6B2|nr:bile acid:sodium symporter family protein [Longitalea sp. SCSIO 12813]
MNNVQVNFNEDSLIMLNACIAFIMFSVALHLRWENLRYVFSNPRGVIVGLVSQLLFLPILTIFLILIIKPSPAMAAGMLLLCACPGGNVSNFFSLVGRGNIELSITLTTISSFSSVFMTPILFVAMSSMVLNDEQGSFSLPFMDSLITIGWVILIPAITGMLFARWKPAIADKIKRPLQSISMLILTVFIVIAVKNNWEVFTSVHPSNLLWVILHNGLAFFGAFGLATLLKRPKQDRLTIGLETSTQNTGLGLMIVFNFFDANPIIAVILAFWGTWHMVSGYIFARIFRVPN